MTDRDAYVRELARRVPFALGHRTRVLAEVREHLREGGEETLTRFGSVESLAAELRPELRARAAATASWLVPLLVAAFLVPFYLIPENAFPPAPWVSVPDYLAWKQDAALVAFAIAACAAGVAFVAGRVSPRWAIVPLVLSVASMVAAAAFASVMDVQWIDEVPGTSAGVVYAALLPLRLVVVAAAALVVAGALRDGGNELAAN